MGDHEMTQQKTLGISLSNKVYDVVRWLAQILLPAVGAAYFSLGDLLDLPFVTEVVGVIAILITFLGALMNGSKKAYDTSPARYDGVLYPEADSDGNVLTRFALNPNLDAESVIGKREIVFKGLDPHQAEAVRIGSLDVRQDPA